MLYLGHCLIKMRFLIMNEDSFISPALTGDINERLEKRFADEAVRRQSFNEIENIAKILRIGKKFKVPQAELLYQLSDKSPLELYRIGRVCKKFAVIAEALGDNDDDKNLLCRVLNNYVREQMPLDREGILADKIAETFPKVLNYARPDDITVSVFYNKHHEEHVEFSKREIVDKFYSVDYGVLVANLGQIKTPIFGKRNLKDDVNEVKRLEVMSQAVGKLPPAKFMLFALHFDKYIEKLSDILNNPAENTETLSKGSMPEIKGDVEFKDITFRYVPNGPEILKKMSFKVKAGQKIGFVGPSGSGKSTVTKLIQRLYIPETGKVLIDGIDISTVDTAWLRRQIGVVLQENYLFNKSVRENIALTNPAISMDRIIAAARLAGAHDFITELPNGYDTIIEERGSSLSGGQRQRIAIARALVNNPRILIFDEATSALDYESERIIQQNMASICKGRTVFMIAHRLSTVRECDQIITIEKGEITETGTHEELLKRGGRYAYLWNSQTAPIVPNEVAAE